MIIRLWVMTLRRTSRLMAKGRRAVSALPAMLTERATCLPEQIVIRGQWALMAPFVITLVVLALFARGTRSRA